MVFGDVPSPTALRVAILRALHQSHDYPPVFADPFAVRILGPGAEILLAPFRAEAVETAALRAALAARGAFAAEATADALLRGTTQFVILGAGLDTFALRHADLACSVFEVDRPTTQQWKRDVLAEAGLDPPANLTFVGRDLTDGQLLPTLIANGFDPNRSALFIMLGVSFYLPRDMLVALLHEIGANCLSGTEIIFDYSEPLNRASTLSRRNYEKAAARVAAGGEPWITFFQPSELADLLIEAGFSQLCDLAAAAQNARWFDKRSGTLSVVPLAHLVHARVQTVSVGQRSNRQRRGRSKAILLRHRPSGEEQSLAPRLFDQQFHRRVPTTRYDGLRGFRG